MTGARSTGGATSRTGRTPPVVGGGSSAWIGRAAVLAGYCPSLLFPFAREAISDFVQKAGFPQLLLQPINFEALYLEHLNRARSAAAAGEAAGPAATDATH